MCVDTATGLLQAYPSKNVTQRDLREPYRDLENHVLSMDGPQTMTMTEGLISLVTRFRNGPKRII